MYELIIKSLFENHICSDNSVVFAEWISRFSFQAVSNATPSVDSFFLMRFSLKYILYFMCSVA
jgi:hypothetical protein